MSKQGWSTVFVEYIEFLEGFLMPHVLLGQNFNLYCVVSNAGMHREVIDKTSSQNATTRSIPPFYSTTSLHQFDSTFPTYISFYTS